LVELQKFKPLELQKGSAALQLLFPLRLTHPPVPPPPPLEQLVQAIVVVQQFVAVPQLEFVFQETKKVPEVAAVQVSGALPEATIGPLKVPLCIVTNPPQELFNV
jgi:hypothetical protein